MVEVTESAPAIFVTGDDPSRAVAINQDWNLNSSNFPAARNSIVTLFSTGGRARSHPGLAEGVPATEPYPKPKLPVKVAIGGFDAEILYAGSAPGFVGLMQVNARVPGGFLPPGLQPVTLTVGGGVASQPGVYIVVK